MLNFLRNVLRDQVVGSIWLSELIFETVYGLVHPIGSPGVDNDAAHFLSSFLRYKHWNPAPPFVHGGILQLQTRASVSHAHPVIFFVQTSCAKEQYKVVCFVF